MAAVSIIVSEKTWEEILNNSDKVAYINIDGLLIKKSPIEGDQIFSLLDGNVYLMEFGYRRCALIDPEFPRGIIIQDKDDVRLVKWESYIAHGLSALGMGKMTNGLSANDAKTITKMIKNPSNGDIIDSFIELNGLIEKIVSCAMHAHLEEEDG